MRFPLLAALAAAASFAAAATNPPPARDGAQVVRNQCVLCHGPGIGGAPRIADRAAWERRARGGIEPLVRSATSGRGAMPPRGGLDLTDDEVRAAVLYLLQLGTAADP